jgi:SagB-type dehydrogenase family enzyme
MLENFEVIKLLPPSLCCQAPLMEAAKNRKTDRVFAEANLSLKHLSNVLWMANGVNREDGKRTVPSAMALYPLDAYVFLTNGIYLYDPAEHQLNPVLEGDFRHLTGLQDFVYTAPLNVVFIANYHRYERVSEDRRLYLAALDAGHCTQNIYLYCAAAGLKAVVRAGAREKELLETLNLDLAMHQFVVAQTVGY